MSRFPQIVADIGGTNARFAIVSDADTNTGEFVIEKQKTFDCASYDSFELLLSAYYDYLEGLKPEHVCVALAGPVDGDQFKMTNLNWCFSRMGVKSEFQLKNFEVINDFAAQACSVTHLQTQDLLEVKDGVPGPFSSKVILGPGTGLGVASLVHTGDIWQPQAGEGGHTNFAPGNVQEIALLQILMRSFDYVSLETLLCGRGLVNIYRALCELRGVPAQTFEPHQVSELGLGGDDEICRDALSLFCRVLGAAAGNVALNCGAKGGVYLAGGILPRMTEFLLNSDFVRAFKDKGVMSGYMENIPVFLMMHPHPALIGAAAWLADHADLDE